MLPAAAAATMPSASSHAWRRLAPSVGSAFAGASTSAHGIPRARHMASSCPSSTPATASPRQHLDGSPWPVPPVRPSPSHDTSPRDRARQRIASTPSPTTPFLVDSHRRSHNYLRISLTERCNLRCMYCMPEEGLELTPGEDILTADEVVRLAELFVRQGVDKIRLTGGEPTTRKDLHDIVARLSALRPLGLRQLGMTTNGITLSRHLATLKAAGMTHLNISLDTLDPFKFELMTRRSSRGLDHVVRSIDEALAMGFESVKINVVVIKGLNDVDDVLSFVRFVQGRNVTVRFIEYMPFDGNRWKKEKLVPYRDLLGRIEGEFGKLERAADESNDTSKHWRVPGHAGRVGFITSMTDHFCGTCNRLRITADGNLKVCLFGNAEVSLRDAMRTGLAATPPSRVDLAAPPPGPATDADLLEIIGAAVGRKHAKHAGMSDPQALAMGPATLFARGNVMRRRAKSFGAPQRPLQILAPRTTLPTAPSFARGIHTTIPSLFRGPKIIPSIDPADDFDEDASGPGPWDDLDRAADAHSGGALGRIPKEYRALAEGMVGGSAVTTKTKTSRGRENSRDHLEPRVNPSGDPPPDQTLPCRRQPAITSPAPQAASRLTHVDPTTGEASMVDVSGKVSTVRTAVATGRLYVPRLALSLIRSSEAIDPSSSSSSGEVSSLEAAGAKFKGPVLQTARLAGVMGAKRTSDLIPLCHPLPLSFIDVKLDIFDGADSAPASYKPDTEEPVPSQAQPTRRDGGFSLEELDDFGLDELCELGEPSRTPRATAPPPSPVTVADGPSSSQAYVEVTCTARTKGSTGVEMEALTGVQVTLLTLWDMLKSVAGREMRISDVVVSRKSGGKSGDWQR